MRYYRLLTLLTYLSLLLGVAAVATSEGEPVYLIVTLVACALMWSSDRTGGRMPTPIRALLLAGLLGYVLVDLLAFREALTLTLAHLLAFAGVVKVTTIKGARDYLQIYLLGLGGVIVGGYFSAHVVFGLILLVFLFVAGWAMMLLVMTGQAGLWVKGSAGDYAPRTLNRAFLPVVDQTIGVSRPRFLARTAGYAAAVLPPAILVFLLVPRGATRRHGIPGAGRFQAITGFTERVQLGEMTEILESPVEVMQIRLTHPTTNAPLEEPHVALLWRGIALDRYEKHRAWGWSKSRSDTTRYAPGQLLMDPGDFIEDRLIRQHITLQPIDSKCLFALAPVVRVSNTNVGRIRVYYDDQGLRAVDPPAGPRQYEVLSARQSPPPKDPDARPSVRYLQVPREIRADLRRIADRIAPPDTYPTPLARAQAMTVYFHSGRMGYSLTYHGSGQMEPVTEFLTVTREGHCELFASAMALMLRSAGIHSRVVNGFRGGEWNPFGRFLIVRQKDAHTWVEAYLPGLGWRAFDPTPGAVLAGPGRRHTILSRIGQAYDFLRWSWTQHVMRYDRYEQRRVLRFGGDLAALGGTVIRWNVEVAEAAWSAWRKGLRRLGSRAGLSETTAEAFAAVVSALVVLTAATLVTFAALHHRRRHRQATPVAFYWDLLRLLARLGFTRAPDQTPQEFAAAVAATRPDALAAVGWITQQYYALRFGNHTPTPATAARIRTTLTTLATTATPTRPRRREP